MDFNQRILWHKLKCILQIFAIVRQASILVDIANFLIFLNVSQIFINLINSYYLAICGGNSAPSR